jgi:anaerobic magnesium-protoporphyrin IX monomethyl ester cyclase
MRKILLITPPYHCGVLESAGTWLNLGFVYIAGSLRQAGFDPVIYDAMSYFHNIETIRREIEASRPDAVITTAITASFRDALEVLRISKEINQEIVTIMGNVHPTFLWYEILRDYHQFVDYIVRGEGEITLPELLECHFSGGDINSVRGIAYFSDGRPLATEERPFIEDLDILSPAWDLVDWKIYSYRPKPGSTLAVINSSRGCANQCTFCSQQIFWKRRWRAFSPERFVSELQNLKERHGVNVAMLPDENPTYDRNRWERILDLLIERDLGIELLMETRVEDIIRDEDIMWKYKQAGIAHIYVGVESALQETLDLFKKDIRVEQSRKAIELINEHDIVSETSFVLGMPDDTQETIKKTLELAIHYNPDMAFFLAIAPWPYSDIYTTLKPYIEETDFRKYNLVEPVVKPHSMTRKELKASLMNATKEFYAHKLKSLDKLTPYKQNFMDSLMKLFVEHSYLAKELI